MRLAGRLGCARRDTTTGYTHTLNHILGRVEQVAAALDTDGPLDGRDVAGSLGEVSTMLVAAAVALDHEDAELAGGFARLARRCQRAAIPFIIAPVEATEPGCEARCAAQEVTADVVSTLRYLTGRGR